MELNLLAVCLYTVALLCLGSGIACLSWRFPRRKVEEWKQEARNLLDIQHVEEKSTSPSFLRGRSFCPSCRTTLSIKDLIPVISYIFNKGVCRYCQSRISCRYLLIEVSYTIILFPLLWVAHSYVELFLLIVLFSSLFFASVVDIEHHFIPDECNLLILGCGLCIPLIYLSDLTINVLGMLVGYSSIYSIRFIYSLIKKKEMLGLGDVKLLAAVSAWLGVYELANITLFASIAAIIYTVARKLPKQTRLPFGPFIALASITMYYF